jgi:hypothetical protein
MNDTILPQLRVTAVVECPWCEGWTELPDDASSVTCDRCGVETTIADDAGQRQALAA